MIDKQGIDIIIADSYHFVVVHHSFIIIRNFNYNFNCNFSCNFDYCQNLN